MENKVIAKEYVEKNYISKDVIKKLLKKTEKAFKNAGESAEWNTHKNFLYHKILVLRELLEDK